MTCVSAECAPDVLMLRWRVYLVRAASLKDAQALAPDGIVDESVRVALKTDGMLAGKLKQPRLRRPLQAQQSVAAVVQYLRRHTCPDPCKHVLHDNAEIVADGLAPDDIVGRRPHAVGLAVGGHVRLFRSVLTGPPVPFPAPYKLTVRGVYLHLRGRVDDVHAETDVPVGDGVVVHVASEVDAAVVLDRELRVEFHLIA